MCEVVFLLWTEGMTRKGQGQEGAGWAWEVTSANDIQPKRQAGVRREGRTRGWDTRDGAGSTGSAEYASGSIRVSRSRKFKDWRWGGRLVYLIYKCIRMRMDIS